MPSFTPLPPAGGGETVADAAAITAAVREHLDALTAGTALFVLSDAEFEERSPASSAADRLRKRIGREIGAVERVTASVRQVEGSYRFWIVALSEHDAEKADGLQGQDKSVYVGALTPYDPEA